MDLDEFSDDGFDDLPDNALQELEYNAIQLTQGRAQSRQTHVQQQTEYPEVIWVEDDDLDTTEVINDAGVPIGRPVGDNTLQQQNQSSQQQHQDSRRSMPPPNPRWNPVLDPSKRRNNGQQQTGPPSEGPTSRPMYTSQQFQSQSNYQRPQMTQFSRPPVPQNRFEPPQQSQNQPGDVVSALQQRLRALEAELNAARGEVSIIRSNSIKSQQVHDTEVLRLKKINAEQLAKQERIAEAAVVAEQNANTELQFLQRDMREVSDRARRKDNATALGSETTTPKKASKSWRMADGFDDMEIVLSPGKGRNRSAGGVAASVGERTPTKGKRKRPMVDSPVMALETHTDDFAASFPKSEKAVPQSVVVVAQPPALLFEVCHSISIAYIH